MGTCLKISSFTHHAHAEHSLFFFNFKKRLVHAGREKLRRGKNGSSKTNARKTLGKLPARRVASQRRSEKHSGTLNHLENGNRQTAHSHSSCENKKHFRRICSRIAYQEHSAVVIRSVKRPICFHTRGVHTEAIQFPLSTRRVLPRDLKKFHGILSALFWLKCTRTGLVRCTQDEKLRLPLKRNRSPK